MARTIELTLGLVAIVDDEDYEWLSQRKWYACERRKGSGVFCARHSSIGTGHVQMHRVIMNPPNGFHIDHINGDTLDNRRCNLRLCIPSQNSANMRFHKRNSSGFKGVCFDKAKGRWRAAISVNGKCRFLGNFDTPEEAARAYDAGAMKHKGEFARTNEILGLLTIDENGR